MHSSISKAAAGCFLIGGYFLWYSNNHVVCFFDESAGRYASSFITCQADVVVSKLFSKSLRGSFLKKAIETNRTKRRSGNACNDLACLWQECSN